MSRPVAHHVSVIALTAWVCAQYPLIGWSSPLQPAFAAVGMGEIIAGLWWRTAVKTS